MSRIHGDLVDRSFEFAVAVMNMANDIPRTGKGYIVERQLLRAGTSVGANNMFRIALNNFVP